MARNHRGTTGAPVVSHDRIPTALDDRGATAPTRAAPVGKDPLAVSEGVNDTSAAMEYLRAVQKRPLEFHTNSFARLSSYSAFVEATRALRERG